MTKYLVSFVTLTLSFASGAKALDRILPRDASHVRIESEKLGYEPIGQKALSVGADGPQYEGVYTEIPNVLNVTVSYDSKDDADVPRTGSGPNGEFEPGDSQQPRVTFNLAVSESEALAIDSGKLNPDSLIDFTLNAKEVSVDNPDYQDNCLYDLNSNAPRYCYPSKMPRMIQELRPVIRISRK